MGRSRLLAAFAVVVAIGVTSAAPTAHAQPRPWAEGVPEAEQQLALAAYDAGNAEFVESHYAEALTHYRDALAHWDHPAIHFNMAVCLINLDRPIEAREHLERALAYGAAPLGPEVLQQGVTYQKLLDGQLARLTVRCVEPGAEVTLDGAPLFTAPGHATIWVRSGLHQVVASRPGFLTRSENLTLAPGTVHTADIRLEPHVAATTRSTRRWAAWKPYALSGSGALVALVGVGAYALAAHEYGAYDDAVRAACPRGCDAAQVAALDGLDGRKTRADSARAAAVSLFAVGGALVAAGAAGLYLNQPRTEIVPPPLAPSIGLRPGGAVLAVGGVF